MIIGVPKEIKKGEYRVGVTPDGVRELRRNGHTTLVETRAGEGSGFSDDEYLKAGAGIVDRKTVFKKAELIVKVKEPLPSEFRLLRPGQALFTFLHLAPNRRLTGLLLKKKITGLAYETLEKDGALPLLRPMSEIAGRMAPLMGGYFLQRIHRGAGILPTGTTGAKPGKIVILGAGVVGSNAALTAIGLGMETVVIDKAVEKLRKLKISYGDKIQTIPLAEESVKREMRDADITVGAALVPGGRAPVLITRETLKTMKKGAVIVDVSIDQGGCVETAKPTTHDKPVYIVDDIIHYAVANMPGAYPRTSTVALTSVTLPYIKILADTGIEKAVMENPEIKTALNTNNGEITNEALKEAFLLL